MKKYFRIFVILSTFALPASGEEAAPASGEEIKITKHQNSSIQVQYTLDEFCDSEGYVEKINGRHIGSNGYVPSLGEIELQCKSTGNGIVTVRCYKYKKWNNIVREKITNAFAHHCDPNKKKTSQGNTENNLTRPDSHLSQAGLCTNTNGEWTDNKCTCKPQNGTYYKFDQVGGCYIEDDYRTKRESKKAEQKETQQQKEECLKFALNKWDNKTKTCVCKNDDPDYKMQNGKCTLTADALARMKDTDEEYDTTVELLDSVKQQFCKDSGGEWKNDKCKCKNGYKLSDHKCIATDKQKQKEAKAAERKQLAKDCDIAGGKIIAGKCKCNDNKKIYDPETITCISKTAKYDAALNILNTLNSTLDTTMAKFNKPQE